MSPIPTAKSFSVIGEREKLQKMIIQRGLCGLANDTKWDEFLSAIRMRTDWRPSFRFRCIDGVPVGWDGEWFYHLPFPFMSVEWFDVAYVQELRNDRLPPQTMRIDHSQWIVPLLTRIGLDFLQGNTMIRIFGYYPRNMELFDR